MVSLASSASHMVVQAHVLAMGTGTLGLHPIPKRLCSACEIIIKGNWTQH